MEVLSSSATMWIVTIILTVIPIWALHKVNSLLWFKPKRLERLLRAQGFQGDSYSLFNNYSKQTPTHQQEAKSEPFALSKDVAPSVSSSVYHTISKYGKNSFFWEGTTPKVIISDPEHIKELFKNIHVFQKPKFSGYIKFLVCGLISYEGEKWSKRRRIMNPAFHLEKLKNLLPAFSQSCHDMISIWKGMLSSEGTCEIDVWPFLQNLTCDVISRTAFGSSYAEGKRIFELLKMQGYLIMKERSMDKPILRHLPTTNNKRMKAIERAIHASIEGIIRKREEAMKNGETTNDDLLGMILESNRLEVQRQGSRRVGMINREVTEECKLFYRAGQETTAALLVWTMVLLGRYPQWQMRARQEVLQVFGNQNPNFDGLSQLKIVTMILYEVLRLYPPTVYFTRTLVKDMKLGYLSLPAGINVSIPALSIFHDPEIWGSDAKEFNPERFSEGIAKATESQVLFFPFGWGPRICIGQNFALMEAKIVLSLLLQNFSFVLSPNYAHSPTVLTSLQPNHGAHIILRKL